MSSDDVSNRRCVVQKLDFENCVVTNVKTTTRGRKKLRARITREFENSSDVPEQMSPSDFPSSSSVVNQTARSSSPVLIRKQYRNRGSMFTNIKKTNPREKEVEKSSEHSITEEAFPSPGSPVFKTLKKHKTANASPRTNQKDEYGNASNPNMFDSQGKSSSGVLSSFQIDDLTQESNRICSTETPLIEMDTSGSYWGQADVGGGTSDSFNECEKCESPIPDRKNPTKISLLGRLNKLQQKQASEKLLWQHQSRKNLFSSLTVSIVKFWKEEFSYYIKCRSRVPEFDTTLLIIDSRWIPSVKNVRDGSVLQLYPPWQKLSPEGSTMTVLLSVTSLDILDDTEEPIAPRNTSLHAVPTDLFEMDRRLFIDSLFSSCSSGFLC